MGTERGAPHSAWVVEEGVLPQVVSELIPEGRAGLRQTEGSGDLEERNTWRPGVGEAQRVWEDGAVPGAAEQGGKEEVARGYSRRRGGLPLLNCVGEPGFCPRGTGEAEVGGEAEIEG